MQPDDGRFGRFGVDFKQRFATQESFSCILVNLTAKARVAASPHRRVAGARRSGALPIWPRNSATGAWLGMASVDEHDSTSAALVEAWRRTRRRRNGHGRYPFASSLFVDPNGTRQLAGNFNARARPKLEKAREFRDQLSLEVAHGGASV